jgi:flagellar export protein FliJ
MKRAKRLQPVIDLAQLKSKQGLQAVAYMQKRVQEEQDKFAQLSAAREEYQFNGSRTKQSFNAYYLKSYRDFANNLELAMQQQTDQIATVQAQLLQVRKHWLILDAKTKSLVKTQAKIALQERQVLAVQEQKQQDEFVSQGIARALSSARSNHNH